MTFVFDSVFDFVFDSVFDFDCVFDFDFDFDSVFDFNFDSVFDFDFEPRSTNWQTWSNIEIRSCSRVFVTRLMRLKA